MPQQYHLKKVVTSSHREEFSDTRCWASPVQQAEAYNKFKPHSYVPQRLTSELCLADEQYRCHHLDSLINGVAYEGKVFSVSAAGQDFCLIQASCVDYQLQDSPVFCCTSPLSSPVLEIYSNNNFKVQDSLDELVNVPLWAVRRKSGIDFFKLLTDDTDIETGSFLLPIDCTLKCKSALEDFSWSQFDNKAGLAIDKDGMMYETVCTTSGGHHRIVPNKINTQADDPHPNSDLGVTRCEFSSLNPWVAMIVWKNEVKVVDLRQKQPFQGSPGAHDTFYTAPRGQWITSFCVSKRRYSLNPYLFAVSTPDFINLFDVRKPAVPVASWEHGMKMVTAKSISWFDIRTTPPNCLNFVTVMEQGRPVTRVIASNTSHGKSILLEWNEASGQQMIEQSNGSLQLRNDGIPLEENLTNIDSNFNFRWSPICWKKMEPIEPPLLLYNEHYPPAVFRLCELQKALHRDMNSIVKSTNESPEVFRGLPPADEVMVMDYGVSVIDSDWKTGKQIDAPIHLRLGSFQDVIYGTIEWSDEILQDAQFTIGELEQIISESETSDGTEVNTEPAKGNNPMAINFESEALKISKTYEIQAPLFGWLCHQISRETDNTPNESQPSVAGGQSDRNELMELLLAELIENLPGVPISAWEAWSILDRCLQLYREDLIDEMMPYIRSQAASFAKSVDTFRGSKKEENTKDRFSSSLLDIRRVSKKSSHRKDELLNLMIYKGFIPLPPGLDDPTVPNCGNLGSQAESLGWQPQSPLLPDRAYMDIWNALQDSTKGEISSWMCSDTVRNSMVQPDICPLASHEIKSALPTDQTKKPTHIVNTAIRSLKMFSPAGISGNSENHVKFKIKSTKFPECQVDMSEEASNRLETLKIRWKT
eukprot:jgi/Picsp_1/1700/NSC_05174-R1_---NA---